MKKTSYIILASAIVILGISLIPRFVLREQKREIKSGRIEEQEFGQDKAKELVLEKKNGVYEPKKEFISEVIKTDFKFNALAPLWRDETPKNTGVKYWVRSAAGNKWGDWIEFERGEGKNDLTEKGEKFSEFPVFTQGNKLQYKVVLTSVDGKLTPKLTELKFDYINSESSAAEKISSALGLSAKAAPSVISRVGWGCPEGNSAPRWQPGYTQVKKFIIHHTAGAPNPSDPAATVRAIWYQHANSNGWGDIGYNYLVDQYGRIYEGRFGGVGVIGGHASPYNTNSLGIAALGDFSYSSPSTTVTNAIASIIGEKAAVYGINPLNSGIIKDINTANVEGHYRYSQTACPGNGMINLLGSVRTASFNIYSQTRSERPHVVSNLTLSDYTPTLGEEVTATFQIKNTTASSITFSNIGVATRLNGASPRDFGWAQNITLAPGATSSPISVKRTNNELGVYNAWITYSIGSTWYDALGEIGSGASKIVADTYTVTPQNLNNYLPVTQALALSNNTPAIGEEVTASFRIKNNTGSTVTFDEIGVAGRLNGAYTRDFGYLSGASAVTLADGATSDVIQVKKTFTETGSYGAWITYSVNGVWYDAKPETTQTVWKPFNTHVPDIRATSYITTTPTQILTSVPATYKVSIKNYEPNQISLAGLGIAARRNTDGTKTDTAWNPQVIGGNTTLADLTFPITYTKEGTYYAWPSMKIGSGWHNVKVGGYQYFDVKPLRNYLPVTQSLALSNNTPAIGEEVTASFRIKNNTTGLVTFENLGVATRLNGTYNRDFTYKTGASAVALTPGATSDEIQVKKTFTETGNYSAWITYSIGGVWYNALPQTTQVTSKYFSTHVPDIRATSYITTSPQNLISGQAATYKISIKNYEPRAINLDALGIAARRTTDGAKADTAWNPRTINAGATLTDETYAITFTYGGTYYAWPSMKIGSGWYNVKVGGYQYFSVIDQLESYQGVPMPAISGKVGKEQHLNLIPGCTSQNYLSTRETATDHYSRSGTPLSDRNGMAWEVSGYCGYGAWGVAPTVENERYYINMRWNYTSAHGQPIHAEKSWYYGKRVIITNPATGKRVVAAIIEYGPNPSTGRVSGLSPEAMSAIGAVTDNTLQYYWASNQNLPLGELK